MSDTSTSVTIDAAAQTSDDSANTAEADQSATDQGQQAPEVRDPAKLLSAYEAEKGKRREQDVELRKIREEFDAFKAKAEGKEAEYEAAQEKLRIQSEADAKANEKILKANLREAAKGKLEDVSDVFRYPEVVDLSAFEVGADGEFDAAALSTAVDKLIEQHPRLAAQSQKRFQGPADGGARNDAAKVTQLTRSDLQGMSPEAIDAARKEGRLNDLMGVPK